jgi:hypothetical protein
VSSCARWQTDNRWCQTLAMVHGCNNCWMPPSKVPRRAAGSKRNRGLADEFAFQHVYTGEEFDETVAVHDGDVVLVPKGYHVVSAAPGCELYYFNVMAGPHRIWNYQVDPAFRRLLPPLRQDHRFDCSSIWRERGQWRDAMMAFNIISRRAEYSASGRSIGGGRDKSGPTVAWIISLRQGSILKKSP